MRLQDVSCSVSFGGETRWQQLALQRCQLGTKKLPENNLMCNIAAAKLGMAF